MSSASKLRRLTRQALQGDDLAALLADALRLQLRNRKGQGTVKALAAVQTSLHDQFANPENWLDDGLLMLVFIDEHTGEQQTVGVFQRKVHRRSDAQWLVRVPENCEALQTHNLPQQIEKDPYLVRFPPDPCPPSPPQSIYERDAIRQYLARNKEQKLDELLGSKHDATKLLKELKSMGVERLR